MGATVLSFTDAVAEPGVLPGARPGSLPTGRPRLSLVPTGREAVRGAGAQAPLRITRFGRLTLLLAVAAVVATLAVGLAGQFASASGEARAVTVESGQTLSEIAAREMPQRPIREGVAALRLKNNLATDQVHAGQSLLVPVP